MCNHYRNDPAMQEKLQTWREYIGWSLEQPAFSDNVDVQEDAWPRRPGFIVRDAGEGAFIDVMQWGIPRTMPGKRPGTTVTTRITNVRNLASPFWRSMLTKPEQRCVVPFTRFAEPKPNAGREEVWFNVTAAPVSAFAGIWRPTNEGNAFAFLTCEPNPLVAPIHPKAMPVILQPEDYRRWLAGDDAAALAQPFPSQLMSVAS
jgi:putative SOS response-associated peptidase YedK